MKAGSVVIGPSHLTLTELFGMANRVRKGRKPPEVTPIPSDAGGRVERQLGISVPASTTSAVASGAEILKHLSPLVAELTREVTPNLGPYLQWELHDAELEWVLRQFFRPTAHLPGMLLSHCVCWTSRSVALAFYERAIEVKDFGHEPFKVPRRGGRGGRVPRSEEVVRLWFTPRRSAVRGRRRRDDCIKVRPGRLQWAYPVQTPDHSWFVRYWEESDILVKGTVDVESSIYCEKLGGADMKEHADALNSGRYPGLDGKMHAMRRDRETGILEITSEPTDSGAAESELIDPRGIWDVQIFKAHRFPVHPDGSGRWKVFCDEMTIYFDRKKSKVISLGVLRHHFGDWDAE